jgi:hypothetical protein
MDALSFTIQFTRPSLLLAALIFLVGAYVGGTTTALAFAGWRAWTRRAEIAEEIRRGETR